MKAIIDWVKQEHWRTYIGHAYLIDAEAFEQFLTEQLGGGCEYPPVAQRHVWHFRSRGFLEDNRPENYEEVLDYVKELHQVIWKLLGVIGVSWSGNLKDCVIETLDAKLKEPAPPEEGE